MEIRFVKIVVFTPVSHGDAVRQALAEAGAGHIGNYDFCSFTSVGTGRFRGLEGTKPFIGEPGRIEETREEKIEVICPKEILEKVLKAVKGVHPYEEPAIDIYPLLNE
jgi:hypothetical protein